MKNTLLIVTIVMWGLVNEAATAFAYEWEKDRPAFKLTESEKAMGELILKQHQQFDYALESGEFIMYSAYHRIIYVNNDDAIQKNNRISISMHNTLELTELKARAINKNGKVVYFDKSNLKELKDEETGNALRIFAIEGVELGSEIEYYFIRKMNGAIFDRVNMQSNVPIKTGSFQLSSPGHLKFDFKNYNGMAEVKKTESKDSKENNVYQVEMNDIPAMKEESYSYFSANLRKIEFKLAYNTVRSNARLYTWDEAAKTFYKILYERDKDEDKALDKFVKSIDDNGSGDLAARIAFIEERVKSEVKVDPQQRSPELSSISSIVKYKIASTEGVTRLFLAVYEKLGINCYPAITSDRTTTKFDGNFDSWSYLDNYVIYFPDTKAFIAPYKFEIRYPLVPAEWAGQDALFIEPITIGDLKSALASVKKVPAAEYSASADNMNIELSFGEDLKSSTINMKRIFTGYNASFLLPYHDLMTDEQKKQMVEGITKQTAPDAQVKSWATKIERATTGNKFVMDLEFQSAHFLEKAGPRVLFKAGLLIGPQVEMYRDDSRLNSIENDFNRAYEREVSVVIPAGYTIKNPQDLRMNVQYKDNQNIPFLFESDYTIENNILKVIIREYYKEIVAPLSRYEDFRKVINAAADFNKITLVLEKEK